MGLSSSEQEQKSKNTTDNTFTRLPGASSPDIDKLREAKFDIDPGLSAEYGKARSDLNKSFQQPLGAYLSPQVRDAQMRSGNERLNRDEAEAMRKGQYDVNNMKYGRDVTVAGMTAPPLVQTGSSSSGTGTISQTPSGIDTGLKIAGAVAPLSL